MDETHDDRRRDCPSLAPVPGLDTHRRPGYGTIAARRAAGHRQRRTTMPVIKVTDMAYGKLRSPDLDAQEEFLTHFGMVRADRTKSALYMRGTDPAHHIHVTEKGDPGFIGIAYYAASEEDLH